MMELPMKKISVVKSSINQGFSQHKTYKGGIDLVKGLREYYFKDFAN